MPGWLLESGRWFEVSWCFHCCHLWPEGPWVLAEPCVSIVWGCDWVSVPLRTLTLWRFVSFLMGLWCNGIPGGLASAQCHWPCPRPREPTPGLCYFSESRNLCVSTMGSEISVFINHRLGMRVFSWECINPFSGTILGSVSCQWCLLSLTAQQNKSFIIKYVVNSEAHGPWIPSPLLTAFCCTGWGQWLGERWDRLGILHNFKVTFFQKDTRWLWYDLWPPHSKFLPRNLPYFIQFKKRNHLSGKALKPLVFIYPRGAVVPKHTACIQSWNKEAFVLFLSDYETFSRALWQRLCWFDWDLKNQWVVFWKRWEAVTSLHPLHLLWK